MWTAVLENPHSKELRVVSGQPPGNWSLRSRQISSVAQLCPTLCVPMDCSMPGVPVHHQLLELAQSHVRWVSDAIQPFHPLSSPSSPAFNLSQHQGPFQYNKYLIFTKSIFCLQFSDFLTPLWLYSEKAMAPTPVLFPGKSHGWRTLVGCSPWGC